MSTLRSTIRPFAVALTLALTAAPVAAFAQDKAAAPKEHKGDKRHHGKGDLQFPVEGAAFQAHIEARIGKWREKLDAYLASHPVPDTVKAQIRKDFDSGTASVRAAAKEAAKDGQVTREEADGVDKLARDLKREGFQKYGGKSARHEGHKRANKRAG
jgi:Spy/CpxP family protein refolding chaperone